MDNQCIGTRKGGKRCLKYSHTICEDCGKPVCYFHGDRDKHKCDDSVKGCHSIWKNSQNTRKVKE